MHSKPAAAHRGADGKPAPITDRDMLKLTQQEYENVPLPIMVEVLVAAVLCMWGGCFCYSLSFDTGLNMHANVC